MALIVKQDMRKNLQLNIELYSPNLGSLNTRQEYFGRHVRMGEDGKPIRFVWKK